jgi:hypothetical protein
MPDELNIKDLQCCGNCEYAHEWKSDPGIVCNEHENETHHFEWCPIWEFDGIKNKYRHSNIMFEKE